jgi:hypothetical protein
MTAHITCTRTPNTRLQLLQPLHKPHLLLEAEEVDGGPVSAPHPQQAAARHTQLGPHQAADVCNRKLKSKVIL